MPRLRLRPPGGLLALFVVERLRRRLDRTPLQVRNLRLETLGSLAAQVHHAFRLCRLGFNGPDPLKLPKEFFYLNPTVLRGTKGHFHSGFAVAGAVLDLRRVGRRFDERLDAFPASAAGHVGDLSGGLWRPIAPSQACAVAAYA
jgi:hypothetical protein